MQKIYIVLTYTGTILSRIVRFTTKDEYCHVSIALDEKLESMYSFGRLHPYNPFWAGMVHERTNAGTFKRFKKTKAKILEITISDESYQKIAKIIDKMYRNRHLYKFNIVGLAAVSIKKRLTYKLSFYCAEFVKYVLDKSNVELALPDLIKPQDFASLTNTKTIYYGLLKDYNWR